MGSMTVQGAAAYAARDEEQDTKGVPMSDDAQWVEGAGVSFEDTGMPPLLFMSRRSDLRLTKKARYPKMGEAGQKVGETQGQSISFIDHRLVVPRQGDMKITDLLGAGEWEAGAEEIATYLRKHRLNGDMFEGFWEVDPVAPAPTEDEMDALQDAALRLDDLALSALIEREENGWNREVVLRVARKTLSKVRTVQEEARANAQALADQAAQGEAPADTATDTPEAEIAAGPADGGFQVDTAADIPSAMTDSPAAGDDQE